MKIHKCRVRQGFYLHLKNGGVFLPCTEVTLTSEQYEIHSHLVDLLETVDPDQPSPAPKTPAKSKEVKAHDVA